MSTKRWRCVSPGIPRKARSNWLRACSGHAWSMRNGISFSSGLSDPDEPTLAIRDLTGTMRVWIEIGSPDAARLHKASKAADRAVVYTHKDPAQLLRQLEGARIHRAEDVEMLCHRPRADC